MGSAEGQDLGIDLILAPAHPVGPYSGPNEVILQLINLFFNGRVELVRLFPILHLGDEPLIVLTIGHVDLSGPYQVIVPIMLDGEGNKPGHDLVKMEPHCSGAHVSGRIKGNVLVKEVLKPIQLHFWVEGGHRPYLENTRLLEVVLGSNDDWSDAWNPFNIVS